MRLIQDYIDSVQLAWSIRSRQEAAIQNQGLACHEGGAVRAHPHDGVGDFLGLSKTADGMEAERKLLRLRLAPETLTHRRFDYGRTHDVYPNAASRGFERGDLVSAMTPCLLAQYVAAPAEPMKPATDAILTIAPPPPCLSIC